MLIVSVSYKKYVSERVVNNQLTDGKRGESVLRVTVNLFMFDRECPPQTNNLSHLSFYCILLNICDWSQGQDEVRYS
jgi:hypothetical protein